MRYIFGVLFLITISASFVCRGDDDKQNDELNPLDPTRDIYQMKPGYPSIPMTWPLTGGLRKCRLPDPVTVDELKKQLEMQELRHKQDMKEKERERDVNQKQWESFWGGILKIAGWIAVAIGIAGHCVTTLPVVKNWASSIITLGAGGVLGGLAIQKTVQADKYITVGFWLLLGFGAMYLFRNWSISHLPNNIGTAIDKLRKKKKDD